MTRAVHVLIFIAAPAWRQVQAMLLLPVERTPGCLKEPPALVLHRELGAFAVNYEINAYC